MKDYKLSSFICSRVEFSSYTTVKGKTFFKLPSNNSSRSMKIQENPVFPVKFEFIQRIVKRDTKRAS